IQEAHERSATKDSKGFLDQLRRQVLAHNDFGTAANAPKGSEVGWPRVGKEAVTQAELAAATPTRALSRNTRFDAVSIVVTV
ncbi:hypothetical protein HDU78_010316, partial [Chytriomyces hyalinus]